MADVHDLPERALVELAAVAGGIDGISYWGENPIHRGIYVGGAAYWNPLYDDAAAFRLMARLSLTVVCKDHECEVFDEGGVFLTSVPISAHPNQAAEAARLAITRAAASTVPP